MGRLLAASIGLVLLFALLPRPTVAQDAEDWERIKEKIQQKLEERFEQLREELRAEVEGLLEEAIRKLRGEERTTPPPEEETPEQPGKPGYLGIRIRPIDDEDREVLGIDPGVGVQVESVEPGRPAEKAGFEPGDAIIAVNDRIIDDVRALQKAIEEAGAGARVEVVIVREGGEEVVLRPRLMVHPRYEEEEARPEAPEGVPFEESRRREPRSGPESIPPGKLRERIHKFLSQLQDEEEPTAPEEEREKSPRGRLEELFDQAFGEDDDEEGAEPEEEGPRNPLEDLFGDQGLEELLRRFGGEEGGKNLRELMEKLFGSEEGQEQMKEMMERMRELFGGRIPGMPEEEDWAEEDEPVEEQAGRPWLGVVPEEVDDALRAHLDLPEGGVLLREVFPDSPAAAGGLKANDIVVAFDGKKLEGPDQLRELINEKQAGDKVELRVLRRGKKKKLTLTLGAEEM